MTMKDRKCVFTTAQRGRIEQKIIIIIKERYDRGQAPESDVTEGLRPHPSLHFHHFTCPIWQHCQSLINHLSESAASTPVETMQTAAEPIRPRRCKGHCTLGLRNRVGRCDSDRSGNVDRVGDREVDEVGPCRWGGLLNLTGEV